MAEGLSVDPVVLAGSFPIEDMIRMAGEFEDGVHQIVAKAVAAAGNDPTGQSIVAAVREQERQVMETTAAFTDAAKGAKAGIYAAAEAYDRVAKHAEEAVASVPKPQPQPRR